MTLPQIIVLFSFVFGMCAGQAQRAILYDRYNQQGNTFWIPGAYESDLSVANFDNRARSVCVTGIWLFYAESNYNPKGDDVVQYVYGKNNYCTNLLTTAGKVSSVRYAGNPKDYTIDSLTLFEHTWFQGKEEHTLNELATLQYVQGSHQSVIITGSSDWTVFDQPYFHGNSLCLRKPNQNAETPAFLDDIQSSGGIPSGAIMSIRKGCTSQHKVELILMGGEGA